MKKNDIMFSIIIPVYNAEKYIERTVESVLKQTYDGFELILINDGSKDSSKEKCEKLAQVNKKVIFFDKKNEGVSKTRNFGIQKSNYKYICFMDADDYIDKDMLEEYANIIEKYPSLEMINSGYFSEVFSNENIQHDKIFLKEKFYFNREEMQKDFVLFWDKHLLYNIWNKVYIKDIILKNKINFPNYNWGEDIEFNREYLLSINNIYNTEKCFYHYIRGREDTITGKYIENLYEIRLRENQEFKDYFDKFGIKKSNYEEFCARRHIERTLGCIENLFNEECKMSFKEKYKEIKKIIYDETTREELKKIKPQSKKIKILLIPYRVKSVLLAMIMGKGLAFCKRKFPQLFNSLKNKR